MFQKIRYVALLFILISTSGCFAMWQSTEVENIPYKDVFNITSLMISSQGFEILDANPHTGEIETKWDHRKLLDRGKFPRRRKVFAEVNPDGDDMIEVKVKVRQDVLWRTYTAYFDLENEKDWEPYGEDRETALNIIARIKMVVQDFKPSDDFYNRYKRVEDLRSDDQEESVPDILKPPTKK